MMKKIITLILWIMVLTIILFLVLIIVAVGDDPDLDPGTWLIIFFIIGILLPAINAGIKVVASKINAKIKNILRTIHKKRVQYIAETEAIKVQTQKEVMVDDSKKLQAVINKAIAKGDTETAQALLKILNKNK